MRLAIATIIGHIRQDEIKKAIDIACARGIDSVQFGMISRYADDKRPIDELTRYIYNSIKI